MRKAAGPERLILTFTRKASRIKVLNPMPRKMSLLLQGTALSGNDQFLAILAPIKLLVFYFLKNASSSYFGKLVVCLPSPHNGASSCTLCWLDTNLPQEANGRLRRTSVRAFLTGAILRSRSGGVAFHVDSYYKIYSIQDGFKSALIYDMKIKEQVG